MVKKPEKCDQVATDALVKRIDYLVDVALKFAASAPNVSHHCMRTALCFLRDLDGSKCQRHHCNAIIAIPRGQRAWYCPSCGVVRTFCINTSVTCERTKHRHRRECLVRSQHTEKGAKKPKSIGLPAPSIYHKNMMVYTCKICNTRNVFPGDTKPLPSPKKKRKLG